MNGKRPGQWIALACRWERDPKFAGLSPAAKLAWIRGLCLAGEQESDGYLPRNWLDRGDRRVAKLLVDRGLWIEVDGGWSIPPDTWSRWQDTAEQRAAARARWRAAKAKVPRGNPRRIPPTSGSGVGTGPPKGAPVTRDPPLEIVSSSEPWIDEGGRWFVGHPTRQDGT